MTSPDENTYIVAATHAWNRGVFETRLTKLPGRWVMFDRPEQLTTEALDKFRPRMVFFLHWSWKVPEEITGKYDCIVFHMTDVPYGRGGSPLQNLILRGHKSTVLSAIGMTQDLDAGPVYMKRPLTLDGAAHEIYKRAAEISADMIGNIVDDVPDHVPQTGEPVVFKRRTPAQSQVPSSLSPAQLFDFIRMLDADGYPRAFLETSDYRLQFSDAQMADGSVRATATFVFVEEAAE